MLKMLALKMLLLKKNIAIIYYKQKLILLGRNGTRQAKSLIFIVVPQAEQVAKVKKTKRDVIRS